MKNFKGIVYAALSSSTFGLAPLFSILLLSDGFSSFEVLSYRCLLYTSDAADD